MPEVLAYRMMNDLTSKFRKKLIKNSICFKGSKLTGWETTQPENFRNIIKNIQRDLPESVLEIFIARWRTI